MTFPRTERLSLPAEESEFDRERIRALEAKVRELEDENADLKRRWRDDEPLPASNVRKIR